MNASRGPLGRAAGISCAMIALASVAACASRTPSATSAAGTSPAPGPSSAILNAPSPSPSPSSSGLATPTPTPTGATAPSAAPISCTATVSNPTPKLGAPTHVIVQTASGAQVSLATSSAMLAQQHTVSAGSDGRADLTVVARAAGSKVAVDVRATKAGAVARCATSFTPVDLPQVTDSPGLPPIQVTTQPLPPAGADT